MEDCDKKYPRLFGSSVSLANCLVIVGSPAIGHRGKVYTYYLKSPIKKVAFDPICAFGGHDDDGFGISCKLIHVGGKKYYAIIGAHRTYESGISVGAAYIFSTQNEGASWVQDKKLLPPVSLNRGYFGCSVDLIPGTCIVGSYGDNTHGLRSGSVHIYVNSTMSNPDGWFLAHSIYPNQTFRSYQPSDCDIPGTYVNGYFGFSVSIQDNYAVVGAPSEGKGSAFVFYSNSRWVDYVDDTKIIYSRELANMRSNRFGFHVSTEGNRILVGAPGRDGINGTAKLFDLNMYVMHPNYTLNIPTTEIITGKEFTTQSLSSRSLFGRSTCIRGDHLLVSGHGRTCEGKHIGSAFLFNETSNNDDTICPRACLRDKLSLELFGHDVDMSDRYIIIGDPSKDLVHVYDSIRLKANHVIKRWFASELKLFMPDFFSYSVNIHDH